MVCRYWPARLFEYEEVKVSVPAAYLGVVLIWATTPLGIKWSGEGVGFLFGVTGGMAIGLIACLLLVALRSRRMRWHRRALYTYLAAGLGIWSAMTIVYWAAQHIPSGLISVVFGLTLVVTGALAAIWLREHVFSPFCVIGMLLGIVGLVVIFGRLPALGEHAVAQQIADQASVNDPWDHRRIGGRCGDGVARWQICRSVVRSGYAAGRRSQRIADAVGVD